MVKEDKSTPKIEQTLMFKVIEFSKEAKKITLSHTKTWQENKEEEEKRVVSEEKKKQKEISKINDNVEKSTLGDLSVLQNLQADLKKKEK
jgi:small subunit ribosomal protein S1